MNIKRWIQLFFIIPSVILSIIISMNFLVDPYSITSYNVFHIANKFARDDRIEKVAKLKHHKAYDTVLLGSSRVYSWNPLMVSRYLGGSVYNAGVGTARIEDHLGFLLLLARLNKLPKTLVVGLDFYTFNDELETNKYFSKNSDLNFLHAKVNHENYISNFVSIDATRASFKTLKKHLSSSTSKGRFDSNGAANAASENFSFKREKSTCKEYSLADILKELAFVKTLSYQKISTKRLEYLDQLIVLCAQNNIKLYLFMTPLHASLLKVINEDKLLSKNLKSLKERIAQKHPFYDFMLRNSITQNSVYFSNLTHAHAEVGNRVFSSMFDEARDVEDKEFYHLLVPSK